MAGFLDLVSLMDTYKGTMKNVIFYGRISSRLTYPACLTEGVSVSDTGMFVRVDIFGVDLGYHRDYLKSVGIEERDNLYRVNGSLVTFVEQGRHKFPDMFKFEGTLRAYNRCKNYFNVFSFRKRPDGSWSINPTFIEHIDNIVGIFGEETPDVKSRLAGLPSFTHKMGTVLSNPVPQDNAKNNKGLECYSEDGVYYTTTSNTGGNGEVFTPVCRARVEAYSSNAREYKKYLEGTDKRKKNFINKIKDNYGVDNNCNKYITYTVNSLIRSYKRKPSPEGMTGKAVILKYLSSISLSGGKYMGTTAKGYLSDVFNDIAEYILSGEPSVVSATGDAWKVCKEAFGDPERFYVGVVSSIVSGVSFEQLDELRGLCDKNGISISKLLNENPYALQLLGVSGRDVEYLALCFGKASDAGLNRYRNIAVIGNYIDSENSHTVFSVKDMYLSRIGVSVTPAKYEAIRKTGTYLTKAMQVNLKTYIGDYDRTYSRSISWQKSGYNFVNKMSSQEIGRAVQDYNDSGIGVVFDGYVTSSSLLKKELYVYDKLYQLGNHVYDYSKDDIDKYIDEYEGIKGFKLEERQREAVHLCMVQAGAVTGGAGSGKTTSCDCFIYVLGKLEENLKFKFAAPTGKAAKRLQEVVHENVLTMNSMFKVGISSGNVLDDEEEGGLEDTGVCYIFDENAMVTIDLMYSVLRRIDNKSRVYLFGDFNQLLPIGKGLPFRNLLRFLPTVCLNVSKRAAEGSNITYNSDIINNASSISDWKELVSGGDFILCPCAEETMRDLAVAICRYYLGSSTNEDKALLSTFIPDGMPEIEDLTPDDLQVVTPFAKATYTWGTHQLNKVLQPIFNTRRGYDSTIVYQPAKDGAFSKFLVGDRVIHTERNVYSMQWYCSYEGGIFQKIYGHGICNGEVGKIVGFMPAGSCVFEDEVEDKPEGFDYPEAMRDDSTFKDDNAWFIIVQYHDYIGDREFYIAYRALINESSEVGIGRAFYGDDLKYLMLFYAGTTHKMQGSQCKVVISLLGDVNYSGFITRNMVYTVYTRAEKQVFAIGSVSNSKNSMLSRARRDVAGKDIKTIGGLLV